MLALSSHPLCHSEGAGAMRNVPLGSTSVYLQPDVVPLDVSYAAHGMLEILLRAETGHFRHQTVSKAT